MARNAILKLVAREWNIDDPSRLKLQRGSITDGQQSIDWAKACSLMTDERMTFTASEEGGYVTGETLNVSGGLYI